jgi:hypothetical protein
MPIKPENRHHYQGEAWTKVRAEVLKRAGNCCELCFLPNRSLIFRHVRTGQPVAPDAPGATGPIEVVLTVAHVNQNPADNRPLNLLALCQRCHLRIDAPHNQEKRAATRAARAATPTR